MSVSWRVASLGWSPSCCTGNFEIIGKKKPLILWELHLLGNKVADALTFCRVLTAKEQCLVLKIN